MSWRCWCASRSNRGAGSRSSRNGCSRVSFETRTSATRLGEDGVEKFVATPELHSDEAIDPDPLPPGQVWGIGPGSPETGPSLYRIEVNAGKGSGVRILNAPVPPAFRESVRYAEQNLYTRAKELVGDRDPRAHEFSVQLRAMDNDRTGAGVGLPGTDGSVQRSAGEEHQGRSDSGRSLEPWRVGGATRERRRNRGGCGGEGGVSCLDARIGAEAVVRALRRHGDADQCFVLFGYAGCFAQGVVGVNVAVWASLARQRLATTSYVSAGNECVVFPRTHVDMKIENSFEVPVPAAEAWAMLMNIEEVVGCLPGAQLGEVVDESTYEGTFKARIGPISVTLAGTVQFEERDEARRLGRLKGRASDTRGRGGAVSLIIFQLREHAEHTRVDIQTDLQLSGALAQYGRGCRHGVEPRRTGHRPVRGMSSRPHRTGTGGGRRRQPAAWRPRTRGQSGSNRNRRDGRHREERAGTWIPRKEAADLNPPARRPSDRNVVGQAGPTHSCSVNELTRGKCPNCHWIPAFAGMTEEGLRADAVRTIIPAFAGMTAITFRMSFPKAGHGQGTCPRCRAGNFGGYACMHFVHCRHSRESGNPVANNALAEFPYERESTGLDRTRMRSDAESPPPGWPACPSRRFSAVRRPTAIRTAFPCGVRSTG